MISDAEHLFLFKQNFKEGLLWAFLVAQMVKNLSVMQENLLQSLGQKDPLEKGMATHSSIFAWIIPWTEKAGGLQSIGSQESDMT